MKIIGVAMAALALGLSSCAGEDKDEKANKNDAIRDGSRSKRDGAHPIGAKADGPKLPPLDSSEWQEIPDKGGLKKWDVKEGEGPEVKPGESVRVHYTGWLKDGSIFDSSVTRNETITFSLNGVIKGWTEGIPGMKAGGIRRLMIPAAMAYGDRAQGGIPANSDLVFEVEVIDEHPKLPALDSKNWKEIPNKGGLKIWDMVEGKGEAAKGGDTVTIHYTGWLKDGTLFETTKIKGKPYTKELASLIDGWKEGVPGMKPGGIRRLYIPAALAYKDKGRKNIPANADLIFEIELIESK